MAMLIMVQLTAGYGRRRFGKAYLVRDFKILIFTHPVGRMVRLTGNDKKENES